MDNMSLSVERAVVETNLERCRDTAANNLLEMGHWLNEAKDKHLVPEGEWTAWVTQHSGMGERTAQRMMQMAREIPEGSPLARLGPAKLRAILTLPAADREEAAREMDAEHATSREVEARVKAIKQERDEALRVVGAQKEELRRVRDGQAAATDQAVKAAIRQEREDQRELRDRLYKTEKALDLAKSKDIARVREIKMGKDELARVQRENAAALEAVEERHRHLRETQENRIRETQAVMRDAEAQKKELEEEVEELHKALETVSGPDEKSLEKIRRLEAEIKKKDAKISEMDEEIDNMADEIDDLRTAQARQGMAGEERVSPITLILSAIGGLMAQAGQAPGELSRMTSPLCEEDRMLLVGQANAVGRWAMQVLAACSEEADW